MFHSNKENIFWFKMVKTSIQLIKIFTDLYKRKALDNFWAYFKILAIVFFVLTTIRERREFSIPFVKELGRKWIFYSGCKPNQPALISCPIMEQLPSSEVLRVIMCVYLLFLCRVCVQVDVSSLLKFLCYTFIKCRESSFVSHELLEKLDL